MWNLLRSIQHSEPDFGMNIQALLEATQRNVAFSMLGFALLWMSWVTASHPGQMVLKATPLMTALVALAVIEWWLLNRQKLLLAQICFQIWMIVWITSAVFTFRVAEWMLVYLLLPFIGALTIGWWFSLCVEGLVIGVMVWMAMTPLLPAMPEMMFAVVLVGGAGSSLIGIASTYSFLTLTHWALENYHQAHKNIEEARQQRVELFQVQEDLTLANRELARLSSRLKVVTQAAEEARRAKEDFVANVSHELRTPLNMVIGFCEVIADSPRVYGTLPQALMADIAAIQRNGQHLMALVNDVLDLSQIEAGRMALSKEWTTAQEILEGSLGAVKALFESKGLYLERSVQEAPVHMFCDSTRIREVLLNLLSNAGRFTERGGVRVSVVQNLNQDAVTFTVTDTGPGISPENLKKLFEPFQQLDNSLRRREGTGLGLSISKRFVEMHGGSMWAESQVGSGTTFIFTLPLLPPVTQMLDSASAARWINPYMPDKTLRKSKAPAPVVMPRYVLLEKGQAVYELIKRYLDGVEILRVQDVGSAIAELHQMPSQALIVNLLSYEDQGGILSQLNNLPFGTPLVECWVPGDDETSRRLGVVRYLTKPIRRETLLGAIEDLGDAVHTILLVDDQQEILQLYGRMMASAEKHYTVIRARNGQNALEMLRTRRPDVMLLDLVMPEIDGFSVLREKMADERIRDIPVIIISANDPSGTPIISDRIGVRRTSGFSVREFLGCVQAFSEVLSPKAPPDDRVLTANSAG